MYGCEMIAVERHRQMSAEGWTPDHDDCHVNGELAYAAACYAIPVKDRSKTVMRLWPWLMKWWKPNPEDRIRELVKAGALIAAEIDRLNRIGLTDGQLSPNK